MPAEPVASLQDAFGRAFDLIQTRVSVYASASVRSFAVAYSGGLDSSVLLHLAFRHANAHGMQLHAFHIHHGLSLHADAWERHCAQECARLGVRFDVRRISVADRDKHGTEQAARLGRYAALGELCRTHAVPLLLTAHHQDDQAETVLLQLMRGAGVAGIGGMESVNGAPGLLGDPHLLIGRPLLDVPRTVLAQYAVQQGVAHIEDESNADHLYTRNMLRHKIMPILHECFPGFVGRLHRSARHAQSAQRLLEALASQDLTACQAGEGIVIERLRKLDQDRIDNLLRYWLALHGMRMPATAWLDEMREQLFNAKEDARIRIIHPDGEVRRHRGMIFLTPRRDEGEPGIPPALFRWNGEAKRSFPAYGGSLYFDAAAEGIDADWLRAQQLQLRYRRGGETLKPSPNRPSRSLKHHYQERGIPAWERERLPLLWADKQLLFAAGIGMNWKNTPVTQGENAVVLRWESGIIGERQDF